MRGGGRGVTIQYITRSNYTIWRSVKLLFLENEKKIQYLQNAVQRNNCQVFLKMPDRGEKRCVALKNNILLKSDFVSPKLEMTLKRVAIPPTHLK